MMYSKKIFFLVLLAGLLVVSSSGIRMVEADPYKSCGAPAVVGFATKPNIMIVMDYSGSMQFPAYFPDNWGGYYSSYVADCYDTSTSMTYDQSVTYYGLFHSDKYYVYNSTDDHFEPAGTQPVTTFAFTAVSESRDAGNSIEFFAEGHNFQIGDLVAIYGLTSHDNLNGQAHRVEAVNGTTSFKITAKWNGVPDAASGNVQERVLGHVTTGLSGNILNFATTSRIDAALKALIGGRADCPTGDYCYLRGQGSRRFVAESTNLNVDFNVRPATLADPNDYAGGTYTSKTTFVSITGNGPPASTIGELASARVRIKIPKQQRRGVIQNTFNQARYGFMYYNTSSGNHGKILVGTHNTSLNTLTDAFNTIFPYNGTPTGPALQEALDYFQQSNDHNNADNSAFISSGTVKDPYYDVNAAGTAIQVPCRKSYVVLISDGEWNNGEDPVVAAREMHIQDLRSAIPTSGSDFLDQKVDVFSIFAFTTVLGGQNAMKAVAMYGGFEEIDDCGTDTWPYNENNYPDPPAPYDSLDMSWPRPDCDPAGTYNETCCAEWDKKWDIFAAGDNLGKGVPDNYYAASNGTLLERALTEVISSVLSGNSAASAVATVSQQIPGGDIIVRGAFEAGNPDPNDLSPQDYLWYGHLEAYLPFYDPDPDVKAFKYAFEECCNIGLLCHEPADGSSGCGKCASATLPGRKHCWDAATQYKDGLSVPTSRNVFTYLDLEEDFLTTDFIISNLATSLSDLDMTQDVKTTLTSGERTFWSQALEVAEAEVVDLLGWVLGTAPIKDGTATDPRDKYKYRYRGAPRWILADIVYSTPVLLGSPSFGSVSINLDIKVSPSDAYSILDEFYKYRTDHLYRPRVVFVGANDGMLHAFLAGRWDTGRKRWFFSSDPNHYTDPADGAAAGTHYDIGQELWAFIPWNVLSSLKDLADWGYGDKECTHCTTVDLAPQAWDVYIKSDKCTGDTDLNGDGRCWRTVIIGGERGGGDRYFAIDVTDPFDPIVLWDYSVLRDRVVAATTGEYLMPFDEHYSTLKLLPMSWSRPYVGRLKTPGSPFGIKTGDPNASGVPQFWTDPDTGVDVDFSGDILREIAFIGGGFRIFDENLSLPSSVTSSPGWDHAWESLFFPHFLALDIETGQNLFKYVWPLLVKEYSAMNGGTDPDFFPEKRGAVSAGDSNQIPYAMSDVLALDLLNLDNIVAANCEGDPTGVLCQGVGSDGYVDHLYVGDLNGNFFGIKFNLHPDATSRGVMIDIRRTKPVPIADGVNDFRTTRQPVSVGLAASLDSSDANLVRVLFGTGKYDNVEGIETDKTDKAHMSFYNMIEPVRLPIITSPNLAFDKNLSDLSTVSPGFNLRIRHCPDCIASETSDADKDYLTNCRYVQTDGTADCCEGSGGARTCLDPGPPERRSCWDCILDLGSVSFVLNPTTGLQEPVNPFDTTDGGERVVDKALIAGGLVFFTTYVPNTDPCNPGGQGFLYVLKYNCSEISEQDEFLIGVDASTIRAGDSETGRIAGFRHDLGTGVPSRPVLDSTGEHVFVQLSTGEIKKIGVDLPDKPVKPKGWRER